MRYPSLLPAGVLLAAGVVWTSGIALPRVNPAPGIDADRELRGEALDARLLAIRRLEEGKERVAAEVLEGRLGLRQAGREFAELGAAFDDGYGGVLAPPVLPQGEEALCRNVVCWVGRVLPDGPHRAATLRRLEEEFRREFPAVQPPGPPANSHGGPRRPKRVAS